MLLVFTFLIQDCAAIAQLCLLSRRTLQQKLNMEKSSHPDKNAYSQLQLTNSAQWNKKGEEKALR